MKKFTSLFLILLFSTVTIAQTNNYNVGDIIDDFTVTDVYGIEHNLYEYADAGKHIYLDFFYDTCGPCQTWQSTFSEFYDKYGCNDGDLVMISINNGTDSDEEVLLYGETYGGPFNLPPAVSADGGSGSVNSNFGVSAFPTFCLIGPDRTLLNRDIWPLTDITTFEATFPNGVEPEVMECTILGATDIQTIEFTIVPSVSNGQNISLVMDNQSASSIQVFDLTGREVYTQNINSQQTLFSLNINSGTYIVKVTAENCSATKKIVIL